MSGMSAAAVTKTAFDAIVAKWSALHVGHKPVADNTELYAKLLEGVSSAAPHRGRQTPLVNAGYATRIAVVTSAVENFLSGHADNKVQLVVLGAGLDTLSIWAHSLAPDRLTVVEVDTIVIATQKKQTMVSNGWIKESDKPLPGCVLSGSILTTADHPGSRERATNYFLCVGDLCDLKSLNELVSVVDKTVPTLVLSELVLTYLGEKPCNELLRFCRTELAVAPGSVMVAFEPMGYKKTRRSTVLEGYRQRYCLQFQEKLQRGLAKDHARGDSFHTLGHDCESASGRLKRAGFETSFGAVTGRAAAASSWRPSAVEPFDEFAALALHLSSYCLVMGFSLGTRAEMVRALCPWAQVSKHGVVSPRITQETNGDFSFVVREIQANDQHRVRALFQEAYEEVSSQHRAVKKMVKAALKTDLAMAPNGVDASFCSIGTLYTLSGGFFLVAEREGGQAESTGVVGCIGVRLCKSFDTRVRGKGQRTYEIHRFVVDSQHQRKGVGKALFSTAMACLSKECDDDEEPYRIIAATPDVMKAANAFYQRMGFDLFEQQTIGKITMMTYVVQSRSM